MEHRSPIRQYILQPVRRFLDALNLSSKLLLLATVIALVWANSPWSDLYYHIWHADLSFVLGNYELTATIGHWISDGLMVIFFFVIGLEIKREFLVGELSTLKQATLPIIAALGGMIVPALIYVAINWGGSGIPGWGIPMATDIAFALGCLIILGTRIPLALKVFLLALAIVDDLGAILVIALFYTSEINILNLVIAFLLLALSAFLNYRGVRKTYPYILLGVFIWLAFLQSGVHATVAGVLLAITIPSRAHYSTDKFINETVNIMLKFPEKDFNIMCVDEEQKKAISDLKNAVDKIGTPLQTLEEKLHPLAVYFIVPVFALANAGISFTQNTADTGPLNPVTLGVFFGLVMGKQIGITLFSWLGVKMGLAFLPEGVGWKQIYALSCLAGIGFTMSLFITNLAFADIALIEQAKIGILLGSLTSAILGLSLLLFQEEQKIEEISPD